MLTTKKTIRAACVRAIKDSGYGLFLERLEGKLYAALFVKPDSDVVYLTQIPDITTPILEVHMKKFKKIS